MNVQDQIHKNVWCPYAEVSENVPLIITYHIAFICDQIDNSVRFQVANPLELQINNQIKKETTETTETTENMNEIAKEMNTDMNDKIRDQIVANILSQLKSKVTDDETEIGNQVKLEVAEEIKSHIMAQMTSEDNKFVYPYFDCQFWASWFSFYEFMKTELGIEFPNEKEYNILKDCQKYGMVFPLDDLCVVCQPPTIIKKNNSGLHCENGPALSYNGDNEIFALNGVVMPKEYVLTPARDITAETVMKETNVEIRRELLRKVGIERLMNDLPHKLLETRGNYELYSIDLSNEIKDARYLKMQNPSIGVFHLEGLAPGINTIEEALKWRNNNLFVDAEILT